jgi:hypothetical protein
LGTADSTISTITGNLFLDDEHFLRVGTSDLGRSFITLTGLSEQPVLDFRNDVDTVFDARFILKNDNILALEGADLLVGASIFGSHYANLTDVGGSPLLDFRNDLTVEYDARLILENDDTLTLLGANLAVRALTIRGGADVAEPFELSDQEVARGSIVVIDEDRPGQLKLSQQPYDKRVAGIISGANGIEPGLTLHQEGTFDGGQNVALTGRVYALADATEAPIRPGDLLTTSATPGHCMKATDHLRGQGAIIGKAMTKLEKGKGMVLVLVSLQ